MESRRRKISLAVSAVTMTLSCIVLFLFCISLLLPFIWMIMTSFKGEIDYSLNVFGWPEKWIFSNYPSVLKLLQVTVYSSEGQIRYGAVEMLGYSFVMATLHSIMAVLVPAVTAYVTSKYNFKLKGAIYNTAIIVMIIPIVGSLPSALRMYNALGIYNNMIPFMILTVGPFGFNFILLYNAFKSLSWSYAEAAFIDGAGNFRVMFTIMMPLMMPTFATLFVLAFIGSWNDYMTPVVYLPSYPNLAYGMYHFQLEASRLGAGMPEVLAGFVIVSIPTALLYIIAQKFLMKNLRVGGLKG